MFDPATGETHFLSDLPALLLAAVDGQPPDVAPLIERVAGPVSLDGHAEAQVAAALIYLESAELVESRPMSTD